VECSGDLQRTNPDACRRIVDELGDCLGRSGGDDLARSVAVMAATTSSGSPPSRAAIELGVSAQAAAISAPRRAAKEMASGAVRLPATEAAVTSPMLWPAVTISPNFNCEAAIRPRATISGWVTAVSLISSASAVVPNRRRSRPASSEKAAICSGTPSRSSQGLSMPGV
jgi:hypothetical protein